MTLHNENKLNHLFKILPEGVSVPSHWMQSHGYSRQLINSYQKSHWLNKLGHGVYCRVGSDVDWQGVVLGIQHLAKLPYHIGGVTALNNQGFAHYLPLGGEQQIHLWGKAAWPSWISGVPCEQQFVHHSRMIFDEEEGKPVGLIKSPTKVRDWTLLMSGPERAIIEMLSETGSSDNSFTFVAEIFEGLATLRPKLVNRLLMSCTNIKAKRLFLFLSQYYAHAWVKHLNTENIDIGKGKRQIVKGGQYNGEFKITVPESFEAKRD